jgi:Mn-dependent DtxR family transcriptional regulator
VEDWIFTAPQKNLINRLIDEKIVSATEVLTQRIEELQKELEDVKTDRERHEKKLRQKESFTVKDIADLLKVKPETVRKNYIARGLIEAVSVSGKASVITKEEYWRVVDYLDRYGEVTANREGK